jgi:hypothetical protein
MKLISAERSNFSPFFEASPEFLSWELFDQMLERDATSQICPGSFALRKKVTKVAVVKWRWKGSLWFQLETALLAIKPWESCRWGLEFFLNRLIAISGMSEEICFGCFLGLLTVGKGLFGWPCLPSVCCILSTNPKLILIKTIDLEIKCRLEFIAVFFN